MKMRLHWQEKYEVVREYPAFELDSEQFPELELEMLQVYNAGSLDERSEALGNLEHKMHHTKDNKRGETIFEMLGPFNALESAEVYPVSDFERRLSICEEE
jgi:hypothetical protein